MKYYLVDLRIHLGENEKNCPHAVPAETPEEAMEKALEGEAHGDLEQDNYSKKLWWDDGTNGIAYSVISCEEIAKAEYNVFRKYYI